MTTVTDIRKRLVMVYGPSFASMATLFKMVRIVALTRGTVVRSRIGCWAGRFR